MLSLGRDVLRPQKFTGSQFADMEYLYEWIMTGMFVLSLSLPLLGGFVLNEQGTF